MYELRWFRVKGSYLASKYALALLDRFERAELALLAWGLVDGFFSEEEIERRAEEYLVTLALQGVEAGHPGPWELVEELLDEHLLWKIPESDRYRTRMAETVRLFARLRQIFPDPSHAAWRTAPGLVADYRFLLQQRLYPLRNLSPTEAFTQIRTEVAVSPLGEAVIRALLRAGTPDERALAGFQVRTATRLLRTVGTDRTVGTIVCAGTGTGKTLAFYLPVYATLAAHMTGAHWTKCLALYPRSELLKDQLREAIANARRLAPVHRAHGCRNLLIGALFGPVPHTARYVLESDGETGWHKFTLRGAIGYECPFIRCPQCNQSMAWLEADLRQGTERLVCTAVRCGQSIGHDELCLTRERMFEQPPDVLFTSTEMLNQRLSSARYDRLFGIGLGPERRPLFVLLDEAHAYEDVHGAHVALLLRRWRHASQARPHFVGLSATLAGAPRFFAELIGIGPGDVSEISPRNEELRGEGAQYMLALRGDSSSGTSLLSTTIQTLILLRRVLDPQRGHGHFGSRVFAFTDDLDVTNRLYHNLLDAEGWDSFGRPNPRRPDGSLANLRATTLPSSRERFHAGQNWALVEDIGHTLSVGSRTRVARTSSQDVGVDSQADVIVATAALEVGFDDPHVGAVLQHKAPHRSASFLQRKGRAGRRQEARPWTVVVLSDWGRDRRAYQAYDQLFSPSLPPRYLPLGNRTVLRMQGTYALFEWLARKLPSGLRPEPWSDLSQPANAVRGEAELTRRRQEAYADHLRAVLERPAVRDDFARFLRHALSVDEDTVSALLWERPRALLTEALPTLLRRLERGWRKAGERQLEHYVFRAPLPEFVPRVLFGDLQLPEVAVRLPAFRSPDTSVELMPLVQAMSEFAPGRVSRRFGVAHAHERHWIDPGDGQEVPLDGFCRADDRYEVGTFTYRDGNVLVEVPVFRPYAFDVEVPPVIVRQSSNASLDWRTEVVPTNEGHEVDIPAGSVWSSIIRSIRFHTHHLGLPIEVRRFAVGGRSSLGRGRERTVERQFQFISARPDGSSAPAALGFVADVDAVSVTFSYPQRLFECCSSDQRLVRGLRPARFRDLVRFCTRLDGIANRFERELLTEAYVCTVTAEALRSGGSVSDAEAAVFSGRSSIRIGDVLETILQWGEGRQDGGDADDEAGDGGFVPRRVRELRELLESHEMGQALHEAASGLWENLGEGWEPWLRARFKTTLGTALLEAAFDLCPRMDPEALVLDLEGRPRRVDSDAGSDSDELWLTESAIGGGGFIEEFLIRYAEDPRRYFRLVEAALGPSDFELVGDELGRTLELVASGDQEHVSLATSFSGIRSADCYEANVRGLASLRTELASRGIQPTPALLVALNARLLRPGTNPSTDAFLASILQDWRGAEERLGVDIDARVFAYVRSSDRSLEEALGVVPIGDSETARAAWRYSVLYGMLWPHGAELRGDGLRPYNRFASLPDCDRLIVLGPVSRRALEVRLINGDAWIEQLACALVENGAAQLAVPAGSEERLAGALLRIACEPVDSGGLLVHPRLTGVMRDGGWLRAGLELPEAFQ